MSCLLLITAWSYNIAGSDHPAIIWVSQCVLIINGCSPITHMHHCISYTFLLPLKCFTYSSIVASNYAPLREFEVSLIPVYEEDVRVIKKILEDKYLLTNQNRHRPSVSLVVLGRFFCHKLLIV